MAAYPLPVPRLPTRRTKARIDAACTVEGVPLGHRPIGMLYARRRGALRPYHDLVFDRFWRRDLNIDDASAIADALQQAGVDPSAFTEFERGEGRTELARIMDEAHEIGVFGVPSFVAGGELYWGREHLPDIRRILSEPA